MTMMMIVEYPSSRDEYEQGSSRHDCNSYQADKDVTHSFGWRLIDYLQIMFHVLLFLYHKLTEILYMSQLTDAVDYMLSFIH